MSRPRVVVVGGGLAGLTAAIGCADAGAEVELLEARARLGGETFSFPRDGLVLDNGQHVFLRCCTAYRELLGRLGVTDRVHLQPRLSIPVLAPSGRRAVLRRGSLPAPFHLGGALLRYRHLSLRERVSAARTALRLRSVDPDDPAVDGRSFGDWLAEHGQSSRAVAALWDLITVPTVNLPAERASLAVAATVFQIGLLRDAAAGDVGWAACPLSELHADAAQRVLEAAGATVRTRARVTAIEPGPAVWVSEQRVPADVVVLAVPHAAAVKLLPEPALPGPLGRLDDSPILNLHVLYDRTVCDEPFLAAVDGPVQFVFDRTTDACPAGSQHLAVSISAADRWIDEPLGTLRQVFLDALAALFPAARTAEVLQFVASRSPHATFAAVPGSGARRPGTRTAVAGLYLAGAWTDTGWPATMEGAVRSGRRAVEAILEDRPAGAGSAPPEPVRASAQGTA